MHRELVHVLYLPPGRVHAAETNSELSAHLTVGIHPPTLHTLAIAALKSQQFHDDRLNAFLPRRRHVVAGSAVFHRAALRVSLTTLPFRGPTFSCRLMGFLEVFGGQAVGLFFDGHPETRFGAQIPTCVDGAPCAADRSRRLGHQGFSQHRALDSLQVNAGIRPPKSGRRDLYVTSPQEPAS
jgi:hypothetical protein